MVSKDGGGCGGNLGNGEAECCGGGTRCNADVGSDRSAYGSSI